VAVAASTVAVASTVAAASTAAVMVVITDTAAIG
jgi:hypothetical protein